MPPLAPRCTLDTPVRELEWLLPPWRKALERLGLSTAGLLLEHYPHRYEDRTRFDSFPTGESTAAVCVCGLVKKTQLKRFRGTQRMFDVTVEDPTATILGGTITCRWFNSHWVEKAIVQGQKIVVHGKPKSSKSGIVIAHPEFEVVEDDADVSIHLDRIVPIHGATEGVSPRLMRTIVWRVLERLDESSVETLLPPKLDRHSRAWALREIHFPSDDASRNRARQHLVLEEFFALQLAVGARRAEASLHRGEPHCGSGDLMERLHASLPFPLTGAQLRAIGEIRHDLASPRAMNRLLHGDVGSGKTLVALSSMLLCVEAGWQAALMAPTQILAEQHYLNLRKLCDPLGVRVSLRTGTRKEDGGELELWAGGEGENAAVSAMGSTGRWPVAVGGPPTASEFDSTHEPKYSRRNLPHFERPWAKYMISFSTLERRSLSAQARDIVLRSILHWSGRRYELYAACVMPDHVHILIEPQVKSTAEDGTNDFHSLTEILHTIKSFTAHEINKIDKMAGPLWEAESFDRMIRSESDLREKYWYIVRNPWAEGMVDRDTDYRWVWYPNCEWESVSASVFSASRRKPQASGLCSPCNPAVTSATTPDILVGTHALLYESAGFSRLGLAVVDEQHKFGVMQRARLRDQGTAPDVLVMTATPIPRTLTMTVYGDLDLSTLDELPKGRGKIVTAVRDEAKLPEAVKFFREHLDAGRQLYVVYPLIDESEKLEAKAAAAEFEKWKELMAPLPCELLHGRVAPEEKDATMERFRRGETKVLVATTVIEVGIDVPNASLMLIENAERFGLAQLHQLRGRIGRGEHKSYCVAFIGKKADESAKAKLSVFERTTDGFEIAEEDLKLRGPGDILGTAQSGLAPLKIGDVFADSDLMKLARNAAFLLMERDPRLEQPEHAPFARVLARGRTGALSQVS